MRRLPRVLFTVGSAASLLLCHTVCLLWARSYTASDQLRWVSEVGSQGVQSARGSVEAGLLVADWSDQPASSFGWTYQRDEARDPFNYLLFLCSNTGDTHFDWERAGFEWHERRNTARGVLNAHAVAPFWSLAAVTAVPPLGWVILRWRSRVRRRRESRDL